MMEYKLIETSFEIYAAIYNRHRDQLTVFATYTDCDRGELMTEWGFKDADWPLIRHRATWDPQEHASERRHQHWIVAALKERE